MLTFGFIILIVGQHIAFQSAGSHYQKGNLFYRNDSLVVLQIFNVIEFLWGFQFLKDACKNINLFLVNFLVSGNSSEWHVKSGQNSYN